MNSKKTLISLRNSLNNCGQCKGIKYLCHLIEYANREFSYFALYQAVNNTELKEAEFDYLVHSKIKMSDAKTIREVYNRIHRINKLITDGDTSIAIQSEKMGLEAYLDEVVDKNYIKYFHDHFTKCRKSIKEVIRLSLKKLENEDPELHESIVKSLVLRWNTIGVYF